MRTIRDSVGFFLVVAASVCLASGMVWGAEPVGKRSMQHLRTIVIDAGHGGDNVGALSYQGVYEKSITLAVALELKRQLELFCDAKVILTREGDKSLSLEQRVAVANSAQADLFISLHANIAFNDTAKGAEVLVLSAEAMKNESKKLTYRYVPQEGRLANASDDAAAAVVKEMMQHGGHVEAREMGAFLLERLKLHAKVTTRGVKEGVFSVLKGAEMAAMVIEMGFLSNPDEAKLLADSVHQGKLARSLALSVVEYDTSLDAPAPKPKSHKKAK